MLVLLHIIYS